MTKEAGLGGVLQGVHGSPRQAQYWRLSQPQKERASQTRARAEATALGQ